MRMVYVLRYDYNDGVYMNYRAVKIEEDDVWSQKTFNTESEAFKEAVHHLADDITSLERTLTVLKSEFARLTDTVN